MPAARPLPAPATRFVGRLDDLARLEDAFARGARLVTLLGPPGIGKSRLALRHAELMGSPERLLCCDLAEACTAEDLAAVLGRALGATHGLACDEGRIAELGLRLDTLGEVLVLLDDFERLVPVAGSTVARWLQLAPRARFLVTSRERLDLTGEIVHPLGPLSLPEEGRPAEAAEAVQLFLDRARAARPDFSLTPDVEPLVAAIVRELDGIPLAIELGASRMGVLAPAQLLARLPRRLDLLTSRLRDAPGRRRTLRDAIDTSLRLLAPHELCALAQVAVFRGGFDLEAAEAVVDLGAFAEAPPLLDVLESLVGKSLLFTRAEGTAGPLRFGLYLSIRDAAAERLESTGGLEAARARHARHFEARSCAAGDVRSGPRVHVASRGLMADHENFVAAHRYLLTGATPAPAAALRIALALEDLLGRWGPLPLLLRLLDDALARAEEVSPSLHARGLAARAAVARLLGRLDESRESYERAFALIPRDDARLRGIVAVESGVVLREAGLLDVAETRLREGLELLRPFDEPAWRARGMASLGHLDTVLGRCDRARAELEEALALARAAGDVDEALLAQRSLAILAIGEGRLAHADALLEGGAPPPSPAQAIVVHWAKGLLRHEQGLFPEARAAFEAAISTARSLGNDRSEGFSLGNLGILHAEMGDLRAARAALERGHALLRKAGDRRAEALIAAALAAVVARLGDLPEAFRLLAAVDVLLAEVGDGQLGAAVDVYRQGPALERAAREDGSALPAAARAARERFAWLRGEGADPAAAPAARSTYVRVGLRVTERLFADRLAAPASAPAASAAPVLVLSPDGRHIRLPDGREIQFRRGRSLRLLLLRLFEERLEAPGRALPIAALFAAGWPGERASPEAVDNRVYVAISRLRKLGLSGLVQSRDDGFLLDPEVPAYRADRPL